VIPTSTIGSALLISVSSGVHTPTSCPLSTSIFHTVPVNGAFIDNFPYCFKASLYANSALVIFVEESHKLLFFVFSAV
jgi:hypothetical protein